jgi:predicted GH43/DUF377 family glycosyl hydrolase
MSPFSLGAWAVALLFVPAAAQTQPVHITAVRDGSKPLLHTNLPWASKGAFNPAAIRAGDKTVVLFRGIDAHDTSSIGYAESVSGGKFVVDSHPILAPEADYEKNGGVEDPRIVKISDTYYLTYT